VFGNLFDNAIEAETKEKLKEIRLSVDMFGSYLHIVIQNRISKQVLINGKLPETSKSEKKNHGIGMHNVIDTVNIRNGVIEFYEQDGWFIADVLLPI
jgi:sensor histidine kinase regulating citrate/malate metabolism